MRDTEGCPQGPAVTSSLPAPGSAPSKLDLAIADLTRVIELDPSIEYVARAFGLRGGARAQTGDAPGATADFGRALSLTTDPAGIKFIKNLRCEVGLGCA